MWDINGTALSIQLGPATAAFQQIDCRCTLEPGSLFIWNLRGYLADYRVLIPQIRNRIREEGYSLVIIDRPRGSAQLFGIDNVDSDGFIAPGINPIPWAFLLVLGPAMPCVLRSLLKPLKQQIAC